ncbi:Uncharacterised protein [Mycobacteroides abscessus subsp. abscessus]|nr:Uncharacterised protein [Mycobacteroides abscessus subsp. abscessus]
MQCAIAGMNVVAVALTLAERADASMRHRDALGRAGRAGCVDHVRRGVGSTRRGSRWCRAAAIECSGVEPVQVGRRVEQCGSECPVGVGDSDCDVGVAEHVLDAFGRIPRIDGEHHAARAQDCPERGDEPPRPGECHGDYVFRPDALGPESVSPSCRDLVEARIRQRDVAVLDGNEITVAGGRELEQVTEVNRVGRRDITRRLRCDEMVVDAAVGVCDQCMGEFDEIVCQGLDSGTAEQVGRVRQT